MLSAAENGQVLTEIIDTSLIAWPTLFYAALEEECVYILKQREREKGITIKCVKCANNTHWKSKIEQHENW